MSTKHNTIYSTVSVGDVMRIEGSLCVCFRWSESSACMRPLLKAQRTIKPRGDAEKFGEKEKSFSTPDSKVHHISASTNGPFIARLGDDWMTKDLKQHIEGLEGELNTTVKPAHEKAAEKMKKKTQKIPTIHPLDVPAIAASLEATPTPPAIKEKGKCAFIDNLLESGKYTRLKIIDLTVQKFGGPALATARTLSARPSIMRKAGREAKFRE